MSNKIYPIGIQDFEKIRTGGYLYIDKTALVHQLATTGSYYFLSRPRRFGKSLLLSTLKAYFQGKQELFKGLSISKLEKEWKQYPVFHLDLNIAKYDTPESLESMLNNQLSQWEKTYGAQVSEVTPPLRFAGIIRRAYEQTKQRVVILVDEYDKPMLQAISNPELQEKFREELKPFYGVLKTMDGCIRFAMLTGVTKFGKVSVFSDLNNLSDISMIRRYIGICGITDNELHEYLEDDLHQLAEATQKTYEETYKELKERYDGYHFAENSEGIYNPFSLLSTFAYSEFKNYWFETGTPTYLVELLKKHGYRLENLTEAGATSDTLNCIDSASSDPVPMIYQSGYLTIKDYNKEFDIYHLGFPNREVEEGFIRFLLPYYAHTEEGKSVFAIQQFVEDVRKGNYDSFFRRLQSFLADTPYYLARDLEVHYQNVLYIVSKLAGFYVKTEYATAKGRIDLILQTEKYTYIMEFKLNGTAEEALKQINDREYPLPFTIDDGRKLYKIGVNFSATQRNIEKWIVEEYKK